MIVRAILIGMSERTPTKQPKSPRVAKTPKAQVSTPASESTTAHPSSSKNKQTTPKAVKQPIPAHPMMLDGKDWNRTRVMDHVCNQLATTSRGIGNILKAGCDGNTLPQYSTFMYWLDADKELLDRYTRGKEAQADFMADEILDIADDGTNDWMERAGKDGENAGYQINGEHVQRSRLRIESRKWLAAKLKPKKYGEKIQHGGADDLPPIKTEEQVSPREISRRIAFALSIGLKDAQNTPE